MCAISGKPAEATVILLLALGTAANARIYTLESPDGTVSMSIDAGKRLSWSVSLDGRTLVLDSPISMTLEDGSVYGGDARVLSARKTYVDDSIAPLFYKKALITDRYNQLVLDFKSFALIARAYDDGVAYRFKSKARKPFNVVSEEATFALPDRSWAYVPYVKNKGSLESQLNNSFENTYAYIHLEDWEKERLSFLPLMVEYPNDVKACIMESDMLNYPGMYLANPDGSMTLKGYFARVPETLRQGGHNNLQMLVQSRRAYIAECSSGREFPWRIFSISRDDASMADNDMVYRLATPASADMDFSWVKPGKVAWEWWNAWNVQGEDFIAGVNNATYRYYIDFASENGIEYVILDEGWATKGKADLFDVVKAIDIRELVTYAETKNVGIILWAGYQAFDRDMEEVCRHYSALGVRGFKVDFMDRDDQQMVAFHERAAATCAKYHLMVDFHGTYKPVGLNRTWPNVINYEGVHGLEQCKWGRHDVLDQVTYDVTMPFIRMAAGPVDYTQGAMKNANRQNFRGIYNDPMSQGTRCHQLAEYVVFESPLNMLCDSPAHYRQEPECTGFICSVPTVWDETVAVDGSVSRYIVMARRKGEIWYLGALNNWDYKKIDIDLSFLPEGEYMMECFRDGANASRHATDYKKETVSVPEDRKLTVILQPGGGFAARFFKK